MIAHLHPNLSPSNGWGWEGVGRGRIGEKLMKDIQNHKDDRNIDIDQVGVKGIHYPITVLDKNMGEQQTVAKINMYVNLPRQYKGTHMSRFVEILNEHSRSISLQNFPDILEEMKKRLNAESAHMEITFPYFINKKAPVTGSEGLMEYQCTYTGSLTKKIDLVIIMQVPISTLCPCSKEISDFGAHNQRGEVRLQVRFKKFIWIEDLISLVEGSASSDIYSVLKREDEKFVTEKAYNNPMFVEDIVRDIAQKLNNDPNITWFAVESENLESIHNHNAYAYVEKHKSD
jgi:GTP cyclohydrolase I